MALERISWIDPSLSGGLFEMIVGCLLGIEQPKSVRVRPDQGDGGVDIFAPVGSEAIDVYQVKHYPGRLHWAKIQRSLDRLADGIWLGRKIRTWHLTVPKQPTPTNITRLDEIGANFPFDICWFGEDKLVALAARHPEVGAYYLGDGRARLARLVEDWQSCFARLRDGESPRIEDVQTRLSEIASALGRNDPHIEYGFEVHPVNHATEPIPRPGVISVSSCAFGEHIITAYAYPRYRGADEDARDRLAFGFALTSEAGSRVAHMLAVGGQPVELSPPDILDYRLPAVGHQAPTRASFWALLTPFVDTTPAALRLILTTANGEQTVVRITRTSLSPGTEGATSLWASPHGCFELTIISWRDERRLQMSLRRATDLDSSVGDVAGDINLMRALQPGTSIAIAADRGPLNAKSEAVVLSESLVDPLVVAMLDALRVIQDHTTTLVTIPDKLTVDEVTDLVETAALLEGLPITGDMRTRTVSVHLRQADLSPNGAHDVFGDYFTVAFSWSPGQTIVLPHQSIELADELRLVRVFRTARVATIEPADDDHAKVTLQPGSIPIWIDQRIDRFEDFTDALHHEMCRHDAPITVEDLIGQIAYRGTVPSA